MNVLRLVLGSIVGLALTASAPAPAEAVVMDPAVTARVRVIVTRYSEALREGDCRALERLLAPAAYETYRTLCEQNAEYPRFLRDFYRGASFWASDIREEGATIRCTLHVQTGEGETSEAVLILERHRGRKWRIARIDA